MGVAFCFEIENGFCLDGITLMLTAAKFSRFLKCVKRF